MIKIEVLKINLKDERFKIVSFLATEQEQTILIDLFLKKCSSEIPFHMRIQLPKKQKEKQISLENFEFQDGSNENLILNELSSVVKIWSILDGDLFNLNKDKNGVISNNKYFNLYNMRREYFFNDFFFNKEQLLKMQRNFGKQITQFAIKRNYETVKRLFDKIEIVLS